MSNKAINNQISRRSVLKGVGLGAAAGMFPQAAGAVTFSASSAATKGWDREVDIVVVGSGAGACSAALFAKRSGAEVLMLEKSSILGGTTAKSAAVMWIPNNSTMRANGLADPKEDALKFMLRLSYPAKYSVDAEYYGVTELEYGLIESY